MTGRRVLVHTIPPYDGGVPAKTARLCRHLRGLGWEVAVAWYATLGHEPDLVAPSWRPWVRPTAHTQRCFGDFEGWAVGCRLPETELAYYGLTRAWRTLMARFDRHLAVGGNVLVAHRLVEACLPHLLWCATPVDDDRADRRRAMPLWRRGLDWAVVTPTLERLERRVLECTPVLMPVAGYGRRRFAEMGRRPDPVPVLPVPVDTDLFHPSPASPEGVVGFAGRLGDPRKNVTLLLDALAIAKRRGARLRARLAGEARPELELAVAVRGLAEQVELVGRLPEGGLPDFYRSLDLFVIPSWQEGLGIVGVEAAASGLPVVSTRCGGPEDYVVDGETGFLTAFEAEAVADRMIAVVADRALRARLADAARSLAVERYGVARWAGDFATAWESVWGDRP